MKRQKEKNVLIYTGLFCGMFFLCYYNILMKGKSLIINDDGFSFQYEMVVAKRSLWKEFFGNIFYNHTFSFPLVNFSLSGTNNLFLLMGQDIFDFFLYFVKNEYLDIAFSIAIVARLWLSGLTFLGFCKCKDCKFENSLIGSMIYVFSGWAILSAIKQPFFLTMMYMTPLLLVGIENIISKNKPLFFSIMVSCTLLISIYCAWYEVWVIAIYIILRCIQTHKFKDALKNLLWICMYYLLGIVYAAVVFLPIVLDILYSNRVGNGDIHAQLAALYGFESFKKMLSEFFIGTDNLGHAWFYTSFLSIAFLPLVYCLWNKKDKMLKWWSISVFILMNVPAFGAIVGFGIPNNRWSYCLGLSIAYTVAIELPNIMNKDIENKLRKKILITAICIIAFFCFLFLASRDKRYIIEVSLLTTQLIVFLFASKLKLKWRKVCLYILLGISVLVNGQFIWNEKMVNNQLNKGEANKIMAGYPENDIRDYETALNNFSFYRSDINEYLDEVSCNVPFYLNMNGVSSFLNVINSNVANYSVENGNIGFIAANKFSNLNGRTTDELLACVKYYIVEGTGINKKPYGFTELNFENKSSTYTIYKNDMLLPIGYTYDSCIDEQTYETLNIAERQEALLKYIVLNSEVMDKNNLNDFEQLNLKSYEMYQCRCDINGIKKSEEGYSVEENDAYIDIVIEEDIINGEVYLGLYNVSCSKDFKIICTKEDCYDMAYIYGPAHQRPNGLEDAIFKLGNELNAGDVIRVSFSRMADVNFSDIRLYVRDLDTVYSDVQKLKMESLKDVKMKTNFISGSITVTSDKYLCFSIPYSRGWTCYIDGEKRELLMANGIYMAVDLEEGTHNIELRYFPYGMKLGIIISFVGIMCTFLCFIVKKIQIVR